MRIARKVFGEVIVDEDAVHTNGAPERRQPVSTPAFPVQAALPLPLSHHIRVELPGLCGVLAENDEFRERFRFLKQRLFQLKANRNAKVFVVTSGLPREGKSVVAMNLAVSLARNSDRVLLIDADMRGTGLADPLGASGQPGLSGLLSGTAQPTDSLLHIDPLGVYLLPAGQPSPEACERLQSHGLGTAVGLLPEFEWVVIDTPPLLMFADAAILAASADAVFVVVRSGKTDPNDLSRTIALLDDAFIAGIILNGKNSGRRKLHYSYYYTGNRTDSAGGSC